jgi:aminomethyltransferase
MVAMEPKSTPLRDEHIALNAKMVDFAGWYMPVEYAGLRVEHLNVRSKVGLFDVSHMGEIRIRGPQSLPTVEWLTTNYAGKLNDGQAQYTLLPNETGGLVDDLIVYCVRKNEDYLLCVNASNTDKDFAWMLEHNRGGAEITNESDKWGQIAVQGPLAIKLAERVVGSEVATIKPFEFSSLPYKGRTLLVARTGYTGEDGVEIFVPTDRTVDLWLDLLAKGKDLGVMPIGLGARDTLRTEMKYPLYGHEIDFASNPYAAGLGWVVKPDQKDFVGRAAILGAKERGLPRKLVGLRMKDRGIARQGYRVFSFDMKEIGLITSGTPSPSLNENIGIAYVDKEWADVGKELNVEIRGRMVCAEVVATPFVNRK